MTDTMTEHIDRETVEKVCRTVLKKFQTAKNTNETRQKIIHEVYSGIPAGPAFVVICDSYNNSYEEVTAGRLNVDVYFNEEDGRLFCMEFVSDPNRELTLDDAIKVNAAYRDDSKSA